MSGTRRKPGQMSPFIEGFRDRLLELGYKPGTVRNELKSIGQLGLWMESEGIEASQLTKNLIEEFIRARRAAGRRKVPSVRSFGVARVPQKRRGALARVEALNAGR